MKMAAKKTFARKKKCNYCLTFTMIQETPDKNFTKIKNVEQPYLYDLKWIDPLAMQPTYSEFVIFIANYCRNT